jgi:hypothetical protein
LKSIVIYNSETRFTEKYALWTAESLGCGAVAYKAIKYINA